MIRSVTALAASTDAGAPPDPGFGVYVHWPFCLSKCPYCDFNSHVRGAAIDEERYLAAFKAEIAHRAALAPGRNVRSVFFGGGTPSLMRPERRPALDAPSGLRRRRARPSPTASFGSVSV